MKILAFDPGETTGWAAVDYIHATWGEFKELTRIITLINECSPDVVVVESFRLYPWMAKTLSWNSFRAVEMIGAIKLVCELQDIKVEMQSAAMMKFPKHIIAKPAKMSKHAYDAYCHAEIYRRRQKK